MNEPTKIEQTLRDALHDAADHAPLASPMPLADAPTRVSVARNRPRALVAACVVALGVALTIGAVVATRDTGDGGVRVAAPGSDPREVPVAQITRADSSLLVYFVVDATDEQIAAVRTQLASSPDVVRFAFLDHDAAWTDFSELYACNPDLVNSIRPEDLPVSFRVVTTDADAAVRVQIALGNAPGVELVTATPEMYAIPAHSADVVQSPSKFTPCDGDTGVPTPEVASPPVVSTVPPTLPAAGEQPTDPTTSHDAVVAAFVQAWDGSSSVEQRRAAMQASDQLAAELDRARSGNEATIATMQAVVGDVTFVAPDRAAVVFHLEFQTMTYPDQLGYAVLDGGVWKVSRETVCDVLQMAATVSCPAS